MPRKLILLFLLISPILFIFATPKVISSTFQDDKISVKFNLPVSRRLLEETLTPEVPGVWKFENPIYEPYLYRTVTFYPDIGFNSNTDYTVQISNIKNVFQLGKSTNFEFSFKTKNAPLIASKELRTIQSETIKLAVPSFIQQHTLSCEVSSLRMALAYKGVIKSEDELLGLVGYDNTPHVGGVWGNPYEHFVGNVNGNQMRDGYGVYWGPIERVAKMFGGAQVFEHGDVKLLTSNILKGNPVIVWVYSKNGTPTHWKTPSGVDVFAAAGEHTVVAVGFVGLADNPSKIIVNDSLVGQVYWPRSLFDHKWSTFSQSGVIVFK